MESYPKGKSVRFHGIAAIISFIAYSSIIVLGFVPITERIDESGVSTSELQNTTDKTQVDFIVASLQDVISDVYLLYFLDYLFIIAGLILLFSIHSLIFLKLRFHARIRFLPLAGLWFTVLSRSLDALENLWVLLMVSNPEGYPSILIWLVNTTESIKWFAVGLDYGTAFLGFLIVLVLSFTGNLLSNSDSE
jgi:uncharacterized membrane protein